MSKLAFVYDRQLTEHENPDSHPESPSRLTALQRSLYRHQLVLTLDQVHARPASESEIATVHDPRYLAELSATSRQAKEEGKLIRPHPDTNTWVSPKSYETALLGAGAAIAAVQCLRSDRYTSSFAAVRPPGHHALANRSYGYCLFNNVAVAARYAQQKLGFTRILIIDWDVHHGNGTQDLFFDDPSICFVSFHQYPLWPADTGWFTEDGSGDGRGYNINIALPSGTGDRGYLKAWDTILAPLALEYEPGLILLSAGYDAHQADPLGQQEISNNGYAALSCRLLDLCRKTGAKVACVLEGGYNTKSLSAAALTTMRVLDGDEEITVNPLTRDRNEPLVDDRIDSIRKHHRRYWRSLR